MARASNLRRTAAEQANAEYKPQKRRARREAGSQIHSIRSEVPALTGSLELAARQLRHSGLTGHDLTIAEAELAHRIADVGSSAVLQENQVRQDTRSQLVDLSEAEGQATRSTLAALQHEAATHAQDVQDEINAERRGLSTKILEEEAKKQLGLGTYANGGAGGLSPTQARDSAQSKHNAALYAHQIVSQAKAAGGIDPKTGKQVLPPHPREYTAADWENFVASVAGKKGVNSVTDAEHAVQAVRDHFQPGAGDLLKTIAGVAATGAVAAAPPALQPIAQFAGSLLHHAG